jgi:membrane fusion protein (multidrug efflux system)
VSTDVARELSWEGSLSAVGSVAAVRGVAISAEAPGVVKRISFESGNVAKAGQVLVELDTSVERAQLATAVARKKLAEQTIARTRNLSASGRPGGAFSDSSTLNRSAMHFFWFGARSLQIELSNATPGAVSARRARR